MLDNPRLWPGFACAAAAIVAWFQASTMAGFGAAVVGSFALLMIVATGACWADWLSYKALTRYRQYRDAASVTPEVRLIQALSNLQEFQADLLHKRVITMYAMPGSNGPIYTARIADDEVPYSFIEEFLSMPGDNLRPVRDYPDKTNERGWAQSLTAYLVSMGFCEPANGNQSARWIHRAEAYKWLGLEE